MQSLFGVLKFAVLGSCHSRTFLDFDLPILNVLINFETENL